jgi:hypothetical protein
MHKHHVGVAAPCGIKRLAGALGNHFHINSGLLLEDWEQISKQPGILRRCRRGDKDSTVIVAANGSERINMKCPLFSD